MLKSLFITVFVLCSVLTYAQYVVKGSVNDSQTGAGLPGASIKVSGDEQAAISDDSGFFEIPITKGEHRIEVSYVGYSTKSINLQVDGDETVKFLLDPAVIMTDAVVINATRATDKTPTTFTTVDKESIQQQNFGQDLPFLINWTPSTVTTSDAGTGIGYTGIRIRGSDGTRINVTINGIPYNDSESMSTFWVDIPDIASSSQSIQIQRGVGTSTNGSGAFGATINLQTNTRQDQPYAEVINSFGSFNTRRHTLSLGSGLLNGHWIVEGRISRIVSDGFIDRASADLRSYYFSAGFYGKSTMIKALTFGGKERTYQSWYGVPASRLDNNVEDMQETAAYEFWNDIQTANLLNSGSRTFNLYLYKNQVDDYQQDHYQFHVSQKITDLLMLNAALHYTPGKGYYEEFVYDDDFGNYGLSPVTIGDSVIESSDIIRRRWLDNDFYGLTYSLNYDIDRWNLILGGGWNRYDGDHFGEIIWAEVAPAPIEHRYYFNNGDKRDLNTFFKANLQVNDVINVFADLQLRNVTYRASGIENKQDTISIDARFNFFNPKIGLTYSLTDNQRLYGSFAISNREPVRDDFVSFPGNSPEHEILNNLEAGYRYSSNGNSFNANFYWMDYHNQLVLTGQLNDVGAPVRKNAGESYRVGIELEASLKVSTHLYWKPNLTLSKNKIRDYVEVVQDYGNDFEFDPPLNIEIHHKNTDISLSPRLIAASQLSYLPFKGMEISLLNKYVSRQYLDNTSNTQRSLAPYLVNDLRLGYSWKPAFLKEVNISFLVNNILDKEYESNGYTWGYLAGDYSYQAVYYYPQAGRNFMGMVTIRF